MLAKGIEDFVAMPSHVVFLSLIYPIVGVLLARMTFGNDLIHLLFPAHGRLCIDRAVRRDRAL